VHSSPGNSFNKYQQSAGVTMMPRSASGSLTNTPGCIQQAVSSPTGTATRSFCSALSEGASPRSAAHAHSGEEDGDSGGSPSGGETSLEQQQYHEYENVDHHARLAVEARSKLLMSSAVPRSRERRNSFRQAVDGLGRPYEQIWFKEEEEEMEGARLIDGDHQLGSSGTSRTTSADPLQRSSNVNIDTRQLAEGGVGRPSVGSSTENFLGSTRPERSGVGRQSVPDGPVYANASRIDLSSKYPTYTPSAMEERARRSEQIGGGGQLSSSRSQLSNIRYRYRCVWIF
jgi:hypothetical protein